MYFKHLYICFILLSFWSNISCTNTAEKIDLEQKARRSVVRETLKEKMGDSYYTPVKNGSLVQLKQGKELYIQVCASCHGKTGQGVVHIGNDIVWKPADFTNKTQTVFFSDQARLQIIKEGIKGTPMMGWSKVLSETDIFTIFVYIQSMSKG